MVLFPADMASAIRGEDNIAIIMMNDALDRATCKAKRPHGTRSTLRWSVRLVEGESHGFVFVLLLDVLYL